MNRSKIFYELISLKVICWRRFNGDKICPSIKFRLLHQCYVMRYKYQEHSKWSDGPVLARPVCAKRTFDGPRFIVREVITAPTGFSILYNFNINLVNQSINYTHCFNTETNINCFMQQKRAFALLGVNINRFALTRFHDSYPSV